MIPNANVHLAALAECRLKPNSNAFRVPLVVAFVGAAAAVAGCFQIDDPVSRFLNGWLVAFAFVLSVSLGAIFFVLIQHLTRGAWSVVIRRLAEFLSMNIVVVAVLFLPIAWSVWHGDGKLYSWSSHVDVHGAGREILHTGTSDGHASHGDAKPWLNNSRFLVTWAVLFAVWIGVAAFYFRQSIAQDRTGELALTKTMEWWSGPATLLFGFSLTMGAFDLLMSLNPTWFSTIFGVYFFSGCAIAAFASLLLSVLLLRKWNLIPNVISDEVQRDLGRLLFAFVFFWGYIAYSQYMLLWYAHMPETTNWLVRRGVSTATGYANSWGALALLLLFVHFVIPLCGLMSRHVKSNANAMIFWCVWMLVAHYLDLYWIVIPERHEELTVGLVEIGAGLSVIGIYGASFLWIGSRTSLFAANDPRMRTSLTYHDLY